MTCRELADCLLEYLAGELDGELCATLRGHLDACPHCVHFVATYQITIAVSRRLPGAPLPTQLLERLQEAVDDDVNS